MIYDHLTAGIVTRAIIGKKRTKRVHANAEQQIRTKWLEGVKSYAPVICQLGRDRPCRIPVEAVGLAGAGFSMLHDPDGETRRGGLVLLEKLAIDQSDVARFALRVQASPADTDTLAFVANGDCPVLARLAHRVLSTVSYS